MDGVVRNWTGANVPRGVRVYCDFAGTFAALAFDAIIFVIIKVSHARVQSSGTRYPREANSLSE